MAESIRYNHGMITGIGIDSIEIARVARSCADPRVRFAEKMFTKLERERSARTKAAPYQHLAACFAAREAFYKATQIRYRRRKVSVAQDEAGRPYYVLHADIAKALGNRRVNLSLTHDRTYATAVCICEEP
jgi:phosphopantetheine--protein transferase-like protein